MQSRCSSVRFGSVLIQWVVWVVELPQLMGGVSSTQVEFYSDSGRSQVILPKI